MDRLALTKVDCNRINESVNSQKLQSRLVFQSLDAVAALKHEKVRDMLVVAFGSDSTDVKSDQKNQTQTSLTKLAETIISPAVSTRQSN